MPLVLNFVMPALLTGIALRAWGLGLVSKIPWFLVWMGSLAASWLLGGLWPHRTPPLELLTGRLLMDTVGRAMAFGEMAHLSVENRPGVRSGVRWSLVVLLMMATAGGAWFAWPNFAETEPSRNAIYSASVALQRLTGFGLLLFVAGFLGFLWWLGMPVSRLWKWHAGAMTVMLVGALLPDVAYAESLLASQGVSISKASLLFDFAGAACWLWGTRRDSSTS